jgi:hypothetical protein
MSDELRKDALLALGVTPEVLGAWDDPRHPLRSFSWTKPDFEIAESLSNLVPGLAEWCPLFEENGQAAIGALPSGQFVRYHYGDVEQGDEAIDVLGDNYQQFAAVVLLSAEEAGGSAEFPLLVALLHFLHGPELRRLLDADPYDEEALQAFFSRL